MFLTSRTTIQFVRLKTIFLLRSLRTTITHYPRPEPSGSPLPLGGVSHTAHRVNARFFCFCDATAILKIVFPASRRRTPARPRGPEPRTRLAVRAARQKARFAHTLSAGVPITYYWVAILSVACCLRGRQCWVVLFL